MGYTEQQKLKERILADIQAKIGRIDQQIEQLSTAWEEVTHAQRILQTVESLLLKMSSIAKQAKHGGATAELTDEFEACKALVQEYSQEARLGEVNLIWDSEGEIKAQVQRLMSFTLDTPGHDVVE